MLDSSTDIEIRVKDVEIVLFQEKNALAGITSWKYECFMLVKEILQSITHKGGR